MRSKSLVIIGSAMLVVAIAIFHFRAQIVTRVWHWRHGNSVVVGNYQFPVPRNWMPAYHEIDSALLVEIIPREQETGSWPPPTINIMVMRSQHPIDLDLWESVQAQAAKRGGRVITDSRSIVFDGETLKCLDLGDLLHIPNIQLESISCQSTPGLAVMFAGSQKDSEKFYELLPQIRRMPIR